jgi:hypothetical protein
MIEMDLKDQNGRVYINIASGKTFAIVHGK